MLKNEYDVCEDYALGKIHRDEFPSNFDRWKINVLELVHSDVCGPMQSKSLGSAYYFMFFLLMIAQGTVWCISLGKKMMFFSISKNSKTW